MNKSSDILQKFLDHFEINANQLAKQLDMPRTQSLYDILDNKISISRKMADRIKEVYGEVNVSWLLTGEGEMLLNRNTKDKELNKKATTDLIPLYDVRASAGNGFSNLSENVLDYIKSEQLKGCTAAIMTHGDSMDNVIKDKDIIGLKPIENLNNVEFGSIYVILTKAPDYELFVKYVRRHTDNKNYFLLRSENKNYDDMDLEKNNIETIWKQKGIIRY